MPRRRHLISLALAAMLLAALGGTAQAHSKPYDESDYSYNGTDTTCTNYDVQWWNWGHTRTDQATAATNYQFFDFSNLYFGRTIITNPANGKWFAEAWSGFFKEENATVLHDAVDAYDTKDVGVYAVRNQKGRVVYHDHGTVIQTYVYDTLGDSKPGGNFLQDPVEVKNTWDPDFDFCALADKLIG
jgi:hypothetical protein